MIVTSLEVRNLRAIEVASFRFHPGFNILVGVNGVGKTTVLDALGVMLSRIVQDLDGTRVATRGFSTKDIRLDKIAMSVECSVRAGAFEYGYVAQRARIPSPEPAISGHNPTGRATRMSASPAGGQDMQAKPPARGRPFGLMFSTRRAVPSNAHPRKGASTGGVATAYSEAFASRELRLPEFAAWIRAQESLRLELPAAGRALAALGSAVERFLPGYHNIRACRDDADRLLIDRGDLVTVPVDDLPDRERGLLRYAIELAAMRMEFGSGAGPRPVGMGAEREYAAAKAVIQEEEIARYLPNCRNLRGAEGVPDEQIIDLMPVTLDVTQLSDGERGMLALVLDLTRRLAQANPEMTDPAAEAEAVVLIDEIELHLHPLWQRKIVHNLTAAFPRCQFIATTHSPQVIGEVEHDRIQIITARQVYSPAQSYGVDSSRVLEDLMGTDPRTADVSKLLTTISREIGKQRYDDARKSLETLVLHLGENDPEVTRIRTLLDFMDGDE